jgi:hypothetical protein
VVDKKSLLATGHYQEIRQMREHLGVELNANACARDENSVSRSRCAGYRCFEGVVMPLQGTSLQMVPWVMVILSTRKMKMLWYN